MINWDEYVFDRNGTQPLIYHDHEKCGPATEYIVYSVWEAIDWALDHQERVH